MSENASTPPKHPLESVYQAREALDQAASGLSTASLRRPDWPAYGSALLGVLSSLDYFTRSLVDLFDGTDRDRLYRDALRDHPQEALDRAVEHLRHLHQVLNAAASDADSYWAEAQHIQDSTRREDDLG
ncbi:hypothetical protein HUO13_17940 [Saccharopolyspora erythraea]|uniref:hypothetical protein n=1 Tax=Saccharopolyspora erythraea TaxID=1836 RepID=UPI001BA8D8BD|nr:hypothetical protein [Saccharopolyspora erythraea]QUH02434.1 hypothetical protein HUO13_17940 [Saccharopolyspora erythraea]